MEIWVVGCPGPEYDWVFLGAYATEDEAAAVIRDLGYAFLFPWEVGKELEQEEHPEGLPGFRWCPKQVEAIEEFERGRPEREARWEAGRIEREVVAEAKRQAAINVEHEVIKNPDGSTTVRVKEQRP